MSVFFVGIIQEILYNKVDTAAWIRSSIANNASYYHSLLALKLVMILCLICLKVSDCSQVVLDLLLARNNIAYLLPQKFVSIILARKKGRYLNLNPEMVLEAFMSINDPLMVVSSENARIHAPFAIIVDIRKSKEEIMSVLFPKKSILISQPCLNNVGGGTVCGTQSSNMLPDAKLNVKSLDGCKRELQMNWKFLEELSENLNQKKGEFLNLSSVAIKKELDKDIDTLATVIADEKLCPEEDTICKVTSVFGELKLLSTAFDTSEHKEKRGVFTSETMVTLQLVFESLNDKKSLIDDFLNQYVKNQDSKVVQKVVSESSKTSEVQKVDDHVQKTGDEYNNGDSQVEMVEEKESSDGNYQDSKTKKGKGKNKGKNSNVDSVVEKQSNGGNNQDPKSKNGKGFNKGKNKGKKGKGKK